ncbi:MAG: glycoside hydrolase family 97 protein [Alistipes sp.]|nr:glycoside hydrolase family 97 protein [Alistipes sp.]
MKRFQTKGFFAAVVALMVMVGCSSGKSVLSPDGRISLSFEMSEAGEPTYSVSFNGEELVSRSRLGLRTTETDFTEALSLVSVERGSFDETWEPVWGQFSEIRNHYNTLTATLKRDAGEQIQIEFRLFNDGVGIRYILSGEGSADITDERTEFRMGGDYFAHWIAGTPDDDELKYMHTPLSGITPEACKLSGGNSRKLLPCGVNTPIAMKSESGAHLAIHEAALWNYAGMSLAYSNDERCFTSSISGDEEVKCSVELPFSTPWRTIIVGDRAGSLVESTLTLNLNEPCKLEDTSWIKPMKYVGVWWEMHLKLSIWDRDGAYPHCATTENVKRYIDFAAENGFGGVLVEGWNVGWGRNERFDYSQPYPDFDIEELCRYAESKGVEIIGHHETYANVENYESQMEDAYAFYEGLGINNVKTGYVGRIHNHNHYDQWMVNHYNRTVTEGAKHKLCIDIHEPIHSTGICRTYPNLVSAEGMRGQEWQAWNKGNCIDHNPTLPFTRNVAGAMDFTPGIFDVRYHNTVNKAAATEDGRVNPDYNYEYFVNSTLAHQLAQYVVFYSPIQMAADLPENYREHDDALQFISDVPVDWATTRCLDAEIGDYVVIARRDKHSEDWYVGGITDAEERTIELSLDFLPSGRAYEATIYRDGDKAGWDSYPTDYAIEKMELTAQDRLSLRMAAGGGFALQLRAL